MSALLELRGLRKTFGRGHGALPAVRGVDLDVERGETVGVVGESGCGKTTLARMVAGLTPVTDGLISFDGSTLDGSSALRENRRRIQMVFQHPAQSLNRRMTVGAMLAEPLRLLAGVPKSETAGRIEEMLGLVGLDPAFRSRRPRQLSGGQQQRVAIARALMPDPDLVVLDEPTSSLDQSLRGRMISLLRRIQEVRGVSYLFISHDLGTVRRIADRVAVMYLGRIVEIARTRELFEDPRHPYTKALLSVAPTMDLDRVRERIILEGETPSPTDLPTGCSFQDRCPMVFERCRQEAPVLAAVGSYRSAECFAVAPTSDA
ncbi:MAG: ATP-binding cassette domain-containing protein [bacterium]|nr:ATP-binding cassette domain-containing protein [Acidimicrobiia bacterium]MCY4650044.1 ATP-binding cassette domain-containing protein [bacterium]